MQIERQIQNSDVMHSTFLPTVASQPCDIDVLVCRFALD